MKRIIYIIYLLFVSLLASWLIPDAVQFLTYSYDRYPMIHFSSIDKTFMFYQKNDKGQSVYQDENGNKYTEKEYYALHPMLYYRQLTMDGSLPDTIAGMPVSPEQLSKQTFTFRYKPEEKNHPSIPLYPMYESASGLVNLSEPTDMFRLKNKMEFIKSSNNRRDEGKSELFTTALNKADFTFPAQWTAGLPFAKKPFDDGYFSLDKTGKLYQIKMVKGRPQVADTHASKKFAVRHMLPISTKDHALLGFVVSWKNELYALYNQDFKLRKILSNFDPNNDKLSIFGSPLYWTIWIDNEQGHTAFAWDARTYEEVSSYHIPPKKKLWNTLRQWLFPFRTEINHNNTAYIFPVIADPSGKALILNFMLAAGFWVVAKRQKRKKSFTCFSSMLFILAFGLFGLIATITASNETSLDHT